MTSCGAEKSRRGARKQVEQTFGTRSIFPGSGQGPFKLDEVSGAYTENNGYDLGTRCFDTSVGTTVKREEAMKEGTVWVLGYFLGGDDDEDFKQREECRKAMFSTNCVTWAVLQGLAAENIQLNGGEEWPAYYKGLGEVTSRLRQISNEEADKADVIFYTTTTASKKTVVAHAVVRASKVEDAYIQQQIKSAVAKAKKDKKIKALDISKMYCSKQGVGGPVLLHPAGMYDGHREVGGCFMYTNAGAVQTETNKLEPYGKHTYDQNSSLIVRDEE